MAERIIHIAVDGRDQGTFAVDELAALWEAGDLGTGALYWHRGLDGWQPATEFTPPTPEQLRVRSGPDIYFTTTESVPDEKIVSVIDLVHAEVVEGVGFLKDVAASIADVAGGRSQRVEAVVRRARAICLTELRDRARGCHADAVVGIRVEVQTIPAGGLMLGVTATGTAVRLLVPPPPIPAP